MARFFGLFLVTCIAIMSGVQNVSSIKWNRRFSLGKEPSLIYGNEDVVGGYNFGRSSYFRQYPRYVRYIPENSTEIQYNRFRYRIISKPASSNTIVNDAPSSINLSDTKNNMSEHISESTTIAETGTKKDSKETTDSDIHSTVKNDHTENLNDTFISVDHTDINPSSSTTVVTVSDIKTNDSTTVVTESLTNLNGTSTSQSEADLTEALSSETITSTAAITENPPQSPMTGGSTSQEPSEKTSNIPKTSQSEADLTEAPTSETNTSTAAITENPSQSPMTGGSSSQEPSEKTSNIPKTSQSEADLTEAPTSETNTSTAAITENPSHSPMTKGDSSQEPSENTSNIPETSQSVADSTEATSSQSSTSTEDTISSSTTQSDKSSSTDITTHVDETSTGNPTVPSNSNRIKVAVSVLFVLVAVMALGVLGTYIIRAKSETVQYDELRLLP